MSALFCMVAALGFMFASGQGWTPICPITTLEIAQKAAVPSLRFAATSFGNLVSKQPHRNLVFSPVSIILALAQLEDGASGATLEEIRNFLTKGGFDVNVLASYTALQVQLQVDQPDTKVSVANGLFPDKSISLKEDYEKTLKKCYRSEAQVMDYQNKSEEARKKINAWVSKKTMEKIPELFKPGSLGSDALLVLANAVYFRSPWQRRFIGRIHNRTFLRFGRAHDNQTVPFMQNVGKYRIAHVDGVQVLEVPYNNTNFSMFIALPRYRDGIFKLQSNLTHEKLQRLIGNGSLDKVNAVVPIFAIRTSIDLKDLLTDIGLGRMFSTKAEFGNISDQPLKVSDAVHEAYIKVNENGTEAAGATGVAMNDLSAVTDFVADHPFLYFVAHKPTSAILFVGVVHSIGDDD